MNSRLFKTATLLTAITAATALALSGPLHVHADDAAAPPKPAENDRPQHAPPRPQPPQAEHKRVAFLGIAAAPLGPSSAKEMGLPEGTGLRIVNVAPDSPASAAGIKEGDVLTKLNDQMLINPHQLAVLVQMQEAGDRVTVHLLRDGKAVELQAELAEHELVAPPMGDRMMAPRMRLPWGLDEPLPEPGPDAIDPWLGQAPPPPMRDLFEQMEQHHDQIRQMMEQMRRQMDMDRDAFHLQLRGLDKMPGGGEQHIQSSVTMNDGEHTLSLTQNDQARHLKIEDADGKVLFDGDVPADDKIEGLAPEVQRKVDDLLKNNRIRLRIEPAPRQEHNGPVT